MPPRIPDTSLAWRRRSNGGASGLRRPSSRARVGPRSSAPPWCSRRSPTSQRGPSWRLQLRPFPRALAGDLNWDYRYSWIRDSFFSVRSLAEIGFTSEADRFRRFIERSAAGGAEGMQIMYGVGGERRLTEASLEHLEGYRGARPVRAGNAAANQLQLDAYGTLLELTWRWHQRGNSPDDDYWRFLMELVENAAKLWDRP